MGPNTPLTTGASCCCQAYQRLAAGRATSLFLVTIADFSCPWSFLQTHSCLASCSHSPGNSQHSHQGYEMESFCCNGIGSRPDLTLQYKAQLSHRVPRCTETADRTGSILPQQLFCAVSLGGFREHDGPSMMQAEPRPDLY